MFWLDTVKQLMLGAHQFPADMAAAHADVMVDRFIAKFPVVKD
jgi:hypothetical protein